MRAKHMCPSGLDDVMKKSLILIVITNKSFSQIVSQSKQLGHYVELFVCKSLTCLKRKLFKNGMVVSMVHILIQF